MSTLHLHLVLNHVPVIGTFFLIALFGAAFIRRDALLTRTALWTCVAIAAVSAIVFFTGEPAEEAVEGLAGVSEGALERHEDVAKLAFVAMGLAGALAAASLFIARRRTTLPRVLAGGGVALSLLLAVVMGVTANLGGQIRHSEIRGEPLLAADSGMVRPGERHDDDR